jgi:hypothetical protein
VTLLGGTKALGTAVAMIIVLGCQALAGPTPSPTPSPTAAPSGIEGRVLIGPTCPVQGSGASDTPDPSDAGDGSPGSGPSFDPDATPEPSPTMDPRATDDPDPTPLPSGCYQPYVTTLAITGNDTDVAIARVTTAADGTFRVDLPPGDYTVVPQNGDPYPIAQPVDVTVVAGAYEPVEINFDPGIR